MKEEALVKKAFLLSIENPCDSQDSVEYHSIFLRRDNNYCSFLFYSWTTIRWKKVFGLTKCKWESSYRYITLVTGSGTSSDTRDIKADISPELKERHSGK
ncbi:hypothetical protein KY285_007410 [Solanum tuberosum]|nr:hypothetical protein KY285_007410 [Solanum tuberosum]